MDGNQEALLLWNKGKASEAITALFKVIDQEPNRPDGYYNLIQLLIAAKKFADAKAVLEQAQEKFPDSSSFLFAKGNWHYQQQQYQEALAAYTNVFQNKRNNLAGDAAAMIGQSYLALQKPKLALAYLLEAEAALPKDSSILLMIGNTLLQTESFQDAESYFDKAVAIDKENSEAWFKKGLAKRALGDNPAEVRACFKKAKALDEELFLTYVKQLKDIDAYLENETV